MLGRLPTPLNILWDMGGTLFDTYPDVNAALAACLARHGHEVAIDDVAALTKISSTHAITTLSETYGVPTTALRSDYDAVKKHWETDPAPLMDGATELMEMARNSGGLNLIVTHRDRDSALTLLEASGVSVDDIICAPSGYPRKPDPTMMTVMIERHGLHPDCTIAIGDRALDIEAAARAGIAAYGLGIGPNRVDSLSDLLPH